MLLAGVLALAACTAVTRQPGDLSARQSLLFVMIALAGLAASLARERLGIAWPLLAGLALGAGYRLAYDPVLPEALVMRLPARVAILEPTTPLVVALVLVLWWALASRDGEPAAAAETGLALRALGITARALIGLGVVLYLLLSVVYDLEGGQWFWRLTLVCVAYLGLLWIGVEGAARRMLDWKAMMLVALGVAVTIARHLLGSQGA